MMYCVHELFRNFEIEVNGRIVHSKKKRGHGFLHTNADQQKAVFAAIGMLNSIYIHCSDYIHYNNT